MTESKYKDVNIDVHLPPVKVLFSGPADRAEAFVDKYMMHWYKLEDEHTGVTYGAVEPDLMQIMEWIKTGMAAGDFDKEDNNE